MVIRSWTPRAGNVGAEVTVRGSFPDGAKLILGGVEVPVIRSDRRIILFTVPRLPGGPAPLVVRVAGRDTPVGEFRVEGGGGPPPPPDADRYRARWDRAGWVQLGEQVVAGKRDTDVVSVGRREGRFTKLMVVVEDSDLEMTSMRILFANGDVLEPALKHFFRENDRTRPIDLPGEGRVIKEVEFKYGNLPGGGQARVEIWGREDGSQGGGPGGPGGPSGPGGPGGYGDGPGRPGDHGGHGDHGDGPGDRPPPPLPGGGPYRGKPIVIDFWPREGAAGTEVTIQGRRFAPDLQIVFDDKVLTPTRRDDGLVTFMVPPHRGDALIALRGSGWREVPVGTFQVSSRNGERERERWREERRRSAERWWKERQRRLARSEAERQEALRAEEERLAREREQRREARRAALRARWEQRFLADADVRAELALHAERTARLERMQRLAEVDDHGSLVVRIRYLIEYEDGRHEQRMSDLKAAYARR